MTEKVSVDATEDGRPAVTAALLALLSPELGHLYLREWVRAVAWVAVTLVLLAAFVPGAVVAAALTGDTATLLVAAGQGSYHVVLVAIGTAVRVSGALDAWMTARRRVAGDAAVLCRRCSRRTDAELAFCHWCLGRRD